MIAHSKRENMTPKEIKIIDTLATLNDDGYLPDEYFNHVMSVLNEAWKETEFWYVDNQSQPYKEYLQSEHWKKKRREAIAEGGGKCMICGNTDNLHVHHITYEHLGNEAIYELACLCHECHQDVHVIKEKMKGEKKRLTPISDQWREDAYKDLKKRKDKMNERYQEMRKKELSENMGVIDALSESYVALLGYKTVRKNLPTIGKMIGETCGIYSQGPLITKTIASTIKSRGL